MKELIEKLRERAIKLEQEANELRLKKEFHDAIGANNQATGIYLAIEIIKEDYKKDNPF